MSKEKRHLTPGGPSYIMNWWWLGIVIVIVVVVVVVESTRVNRVGLGSANPSEKTKRQRALRVCLCPLQLCSPYHLEHILQKACDKMHPAKDKTAPSQIYSSSACFFLVPSSRPSTGRGSWVFPLFSLVYCTAHFAFMLRFRVCVIVNRSFNSVSFYFPFRRRSHAFTDMNGQAE